MWRYTCNWRFVYSRCILQNYASYDAHFCCVTTWHINVHSGNFHFPCQNRNRFCPMSWNYNSCNLRLRILVTCKYMYMCMYIYVSVLSAAQDAIARIAELPDILGRITTTIQEDKEDPFSSTYEALRIMQSTISKFTPQSLKVQHTCTCMHRSWNLWEFWDVQERKKSYCIHVHALCMCPISVLPSSCV